jgi:hypothetical protein
LKPWIGLKLHTKNDKKKQIQAYPAILSVNSQYKKSIDWLIKSIQFRKDITFCTRVSNEIKCIILNVPTSSTQKKKEYYNYAIMFKSKKNFKW